ncbi:unnamed protein product [Rangifer tarandus platyrhynchus]|uniref:Uncharacterized protein n=1 Tax=Rangifer tarandus platyrhynchus TaxID=3082113 RepID=A0AC59YE56_RANTA
MAGVKARWAESSERVTYLDETFLAQLTVCKSAPRGGGRNREKAEGSWRKVELAWQAYGFMKKGGEAFSLPPQLTFSSHLRARAAALPAELTEAGELRAETAHLHVALEIKQVSGMSVISCSETPQDLPGPEEECLELA